MLQAHLFSGKMHYLISIFACFLGEKLSHFLLNLLPFDNQEAGVFSYSYIFLLRWSVSY